MRGRIALLLSLGFLVIEMSHASPGSDPFDKALKILRENYIYPSQIKFQRSDRLETFLERLRGGASLEDSETFVSTPQQETDVDIPTPSGTLEYTRLSWSDKPGVNYNPSLPHCVGVILDLRNCRSDLLESARGSAFYLSPRQDVEPTFSIFQSEKTLSAQISSITPTPSPTPLAGHVLGPIGKPIVVLINEGTSGAPELLAALLKQEGGLLVGSPTAGACGVFAQGALAPHQILRYAVGDVVLSTGQKMLGHPVLPDIAVDVPLSEETELISKIEAGGLVTLIVQPTSHPKMSEAALVRGENPVRDIPASTLLPADTLSPTKTPHAQTDECLLQGIACLETLIFRARHSQ